MDVRTQCPTNGGDWLTRFGELWKKQVTEVRDRFGSAIQEVRMPGESPTDVPILYVEKSELIPVLRFLKEQPGHEYGFLADITATDEEVQSRFEVVYQLFSHTLRARIRVKVRVSEGEEVPTATLLWKGANWAEREVFDMFGVKFQGHPDLRRILMDYRWEGHPLRKDYPLKGYQIFTDPEPVRPSLLE
jgi:NADH-quinone oxidoreductase subunit C